MKIGLKSDYRAETWPFLCYNNPFYYNRPLPLPTRLAVLLERMQYNINNALPYYNEVPCQVGTWVWPLALELAQSKQE